MITQAPNPLQTWKELYDQFEKTWTKPMNEMLGTESFAASMGATRDSYLTSQKALREGMENYLKTLHMPSKSDITRLAGQVVQLESKLEALDDRFDSLEAKIDTLVAAVAKLAATPPAQVVEVVVPSTDHAPEAVETPATSKRRASK